MDPSHLNTLKYHLERLAGAADGGDEHDWERVEAALAALVAADPGADGAALQRKLAQYEPAARARRLPENYAALLHEIAARAQALARSRAQAARAEDRAPRDFVAEAAALLRGRALLVVGGDPRELHAERWKDAFGLSELIWPATKEGNPTLAPFEPLVARPDVAAVLLLIRWARHALNEVKAVCDRHGKPLVRVTAGYNAVQIAKHVVEQCGKRLSG